jgi:hypothetical protein
MSRNLFDVRAEGCDCRVDAFVAWRAQAKKRDLVSFRKTKKKL